jgi:hypothetical protein
MIHGRASERASAGQHKALDITNPPPPSAITTALDLMVVRFVGNEKTG